MDRLHLMTVFIAVAEAESFAGAARKLGMSPPAVTRAVAALETRLQARLLNRSTRHVRATEAGQRYLEDARRVIASADEADEAASGGKAPPRGLLTVTAPALFGLRYVMPGINDYLRRHPEVTVDALLLDRVVNLLEEGVDVAIRIGELPDSNLRALRVGQVRRVVCASPAYLAERGVPLTPADLQRHALIASRGVGSCHEWRFSDGGKPLSVRLKPRLTVSNNEAAIAAAAAGLGVTRLLSYQVAPQLAAGQLLPLLAEYDDASQPIHILHQEGRLASAKTRAFIELMAERLRGHPELR
ncbi:LysR family transcriptional regulator [Chromobacterium sp. S0633]|uniref:LysR family transcriptional regulator n=1 Tax=Chromobacterium sp. S0633 TaxID=2957805 RepID=UPI00209E7EFA|nr:LysR family transcriptional regulator [Chromobacterium sp. S0633]MCP1292448.1 LysR family transcriptional regulator [Chromobacterium sp. S0633]